jgi:hypothetical protein
MATFGNTAVGGSQDVYPIANYLFAYGPFVPAGNGTIQSLSINIKDVGTASNIQLALYTGSSTAPDTGTLVAKTASIAIATGPNTGVTLTTPAITGGMNYWICIESDGTCHPASTSGFGLGYESYASSAFGVWPAMMPTTSFITHDLAITVYGTYTPTSGIVLSPTTLANGDNGTPYLQTLTATGGTAPYAFTRTAGTLPTGVVLSTVGVLSGTPSSTAAFTFTITATDNVSATGLQAYTVTINAAVSITTASPLTGGNTGAAYNQTLAATGGSASYTWSTTSGTLPTGITLSTAGVLSGTPTVVGVYTFVATATDTLGGVGNKSFSLTITQVILLSPTMLPSDTVNTAYNQTLTASGGTGPYTFAKTAGTLPTGITISTAGVLSGTPTVLGMFTFTITATDSLSATGAQAYTVNINAGKTVLQASDFTYQGFYFIPGDDRAYNVGLTHRYVNNQLQLLMEDFNSYQFDIVAFTLPSGGFGSTITDPFLYRWPGAAVWAFKPATHASSHFTNIWYEDLGSGNNRLWGSQGIVYPTTGVDPTVGPYNSDFLCEAISVRTLHNDNTVTGAAGLWGLQDPYNDTFKLGGPNNAGISQRCLYGKVQPIPSWFQTLYSVPPYLLGAGGQASLAAQAGICSFGLFLAAVPLLTTYVPPLNYSYGGYNGDGSDWVVPSTDFKILADHRLGTRQGDWYITPGTPSTFDRGIKITSELNYYDHSPGGTQAYYFAFPTSNTATITSDNPAKVIFNLPQPTPPYLPFVAGDFIYVHGFLPVAIASVTDARNVTLVSSYAGAPLTNVEWGFLCNPANLLANGAQWTSPAPDGFNRWAETDSYFGGAEWIDGSTKTGIVCVGSFSKGKQWYPYGSPESDDSGFEIHVYDPADLGSVLAGSKNRWNVQPASMKDITGDFHDKLVGGSRNTNISCPVGQTFVPGVADPTIGTLYVLVNGCSLGGNLGSILLAYSVNMGASAISLSPSSLVSWTISKSGYSQTITASGGTSPYTYAITSGNAPTGLTFSTAGVFSGTPTAAGTFAFTVTATDNASLTGSRNYSIVINPAIVVVPTNLPVGTVSVSYNQTISTTGGTGPFTFAKTAGTLPTGLSINAFGTLFGTPTVAGSYTFTITATDTPGATGARAYTVVINGLVITPTSLPNWTAGKSGYLQTLVATGGTPAYTYATGGLPTGLTLVGSTGVISGTPTVAGTYPFTVTVTDSLSVIGSQNYSVTINAAIVLAPTTLPAGITTIPYSQTVAATGGTGTLTFSVTVGALPTGLTISTAGVISGTPNAAGAFPFTITATDTVGATGIQAYSVAITVIPPQPAPPIVTQYVNYVMVQGTDTVLLYSGTSPVDGFSMQFQAKHRFEGNSGLIECFGAPGYNGISGIAVINSGLGQAQIILPNWMTSGRPPGSYAYDLRRTDAGKQRILEIGLLEILPNTSNTPDPPRVIPAGSTVLVWDSLQDIDGTLLLNHGTQFGPSWYAPFGGAGKGFVIKDNRCYYTFVQSSAAALINVNNAPVSNVGGVSVPANCTMAVVINFGGNPATDIEVIAVEDSLTIPGDGIFIRLNSGTNKFDIYDGTAATVLISIPFTVGLYTDYTISVTTAGFNPLAPQQGGGTITATINGGSKIIATAASRIGSTSYGSGFGVGVSLFSSNSNGENFRVLSIVQP